MSERAVSSGQTKPKEVLKLIEKGVEVHSVAGLHAKIFVIGSEVFIGSANASENSRTRLIEAVLRTSRRAIVAQSGRFVASLRGTLIGPEEARKLQKLWRPPRDVPGPRHKADPPLHAPLWLIPVNVGELDPDEKREYIVSKRAAKDKLRSSRLFEVDEYFCEESELPARLRSSDRVIQLVREGSRPVMVLPPSAVVLIRRFRSKTGRRVAVYLEAPKGRRRKSLKQVTKRLGSVAADLTRVQRSGRHKRCVNAKLVHDILNLWSGIADS